MGSEIVVLTALPVEYAAVRNLLDAPVVRTHPAGTLFLHGTLRGTSREVVLARAGKGNLGAAVIAERAREWYEPEALFLVGVAGGLSPKIDLGDVVVATALHHVHPGKEGPGGFRASPAPGPVSHRLEQAAAEALHGPSWRDGVPDALRDPERVPKVHFGSIAAGEVVLNAQVAPLRDQIHHHYADAIAIEMESAGIARAATLAEDLRVLTIRGISDHADGAKATADADGSQTRAAAHAAAALAAVVAALPPAPRPGRAHHRGDHIDFHGGTFHGPVTGKIVGLGGTPGEAPG